MNRPPRRKRLIVLLALALLTSCRSNGTGIEGSASSPSRHTASRDALGTTFRLTVYAPDARTGNEAVAAALRRLDVIDAALNAARADGEIFALNSAREGVAVRLGDDLFTVLQHARRLSVATHGAFDVTAGPYRELWRLAAAAGRAPSDADLEEARLRVGWYKLSLNTIERSATLTVPRMRIDLSGIARGYAVDQVFRQLRARGCEQSRVDAGTVAVAGAPPRGRAGWTVAVHGTDGPGDKPRSLSLTRTAIAYSPNAVRRSGPGLDPRVARLIDPVGGRSLDDRPPAAVLATSGAAAESVAYAAAVLGPERADVLAAVEGAPRIRFNLPGARRRRGAAASD